MKTHTASPKSFPALRRLSAAAMLCCALAPAAIPATAWAQPNDEAALNFTGADIESVVKAVGHYTNITFLIDPRVKGTITLVSEKPITKSQAFSLLASALRLQGYAIVSGDGYAKVVPEAEAKLQASPTVVGAQSGPKGDQVVTQVFHLNHENSANLVTVLRPLITPNNTINANPGNNTLVITDYADNLKRLAKIIAALDAPSAADLDVIPVRHAIASDLAAMVNKLMEPGAGGDSGRVTAVPDPRTNSLVVRAPSAARANLAKYLISKLDQPTAQAGNVHVVYLKNAEATKLAETLRAVVSGDSGAVGGQSGQGGLASLGGGSGGGQMNQSNLGGQGAQTGSTTGGPTNPALSGNSRGGSGSQSTLGGGGSAGFIQADATTNTLIITAPEAVYRNLRAVIDQLDVRRAQVYIESMIVEVNANKLSEFGVQWAGLSGNDGSTYRVGGGTTYDRAGTNGLLNLAGLIDGKEGAQAPTGGLTLGIFKQLANGKLGLGAVAHALGTDGDSNILSTPNMLTLDNEVATIKVGQNVPIVTGSFTTTSGTNSNPFQTVDRKDIGITLKVRPQISEGGTIKLAIYNESSSIDDVTNSAGLILKNRVIETNIIADDGQILVLGGLIQDDSNDGVDKVPGLGDIPLIGHLFKYQKRERKKTNLMVFLRPVVVRNREQGMNLTADRYDFMRATQRAAAPEPSITVKNLGAPMLPELQNGQPVGSGQLARPVAPAAPSVPEQKQQQQ